MKHLFVIRHGDYYSDSNARDLSARGISQIERIAKQMKEIVGGNFNRHYVLSSPAARAIQSADIIARFFGLKEFYQNRGLFTDHGKDLSKEELKAIDAMILPHKDAHDIVTIVAHSEIVISYPHYILRTVYGEDKKMRPAKKGEGVHFDLEARTYQMLPR